MAPKQFQESPGLNGLKSSPFGGNPAIPLNFGGTGGFASLFHNRYAKSLNVTQFGTVTQPVKSADREAVHNCRNLANLVTLLSNRPKSSGGGAKVLARSVTKAL